MKVCARSLIHRFALFLGALLLVAISALFLIDRYLFMPVLLEEENQQANAELLRITKALELNRSSLLAHARDWAHWDDTYDFVQGRSETYASSNFSQEMFEDLQYQLMVYFDGKRKVIWVAGIDPATHNYSACEDIANNCKWVAPILPVLTAFLEETPDSGRTLTLSSPWPALVAIVPILRTDRTGPANGWLATVRLIDSRLTDLMEQQTGLSIDIREKATASSAPNEILIERQGDTLQIASLLDTSASGPALQLTTEMPRERFRSGVQTFRFALAWTALLLLVVIGLVLLLVVTLVLRPVGLFIRFTNEQRGIHSPLQYDDTARVPATLLTRRDEFGKLGRHLQRMLDHQNKQARILHALSLEDPLTSLANRRLFDNRLERALGDEPGRVISVMMIDIDHFKLYNDHYGHPSGDTCLIQVSRCMQTYLNRYGFLVARTGGEEFSVYMPDTPLEQACQHAEAVRASIEQLAVPHATSPSGSVITMSIGVTSTTASGTRSGSALMRNADRALYKAKALGRNQVACFTPSSSADSF